MSDATAPPSAPSRPRPGEPGPLQGVPLGPRARGAARNPHLGDRLRLPGARRLPAGVPLRRPAGIRLRRRHAGLVAGALADALRAARRAHPAVPPRARWALPGPRLPDGRWAAGRPPPARHRPRLTRDAQPGCGARPRGTAHRHRRRPRGPDRAPGQEGRPADGGDRHGLGRQLRRDQHPARLAPARRVPHHGGGRHRGGHPEPGRAPRPARVRIGALVFLGLDTWTGLGTFSLALTTVPPGVDPTVATLLWAVPVGLLGALLALGGPLGRPDGAPARPPQPGAGHRRGRNAHRPHGHGLPADHRQGLQPRCSSPARTPCRTSWRTPPTTRSRRWSCSACARCWRTACR